MSAGTAATVADCRQAESDTLVPSGGTSVLRRQVGIRAAKKPACLRYRFGNMKPYYQRDGVRLYCGDAIKVMQTLPDESVHCCVTSPPYWGLRDYGVDGQLGLEKTPDEYVTKMVEVFREVRRVLRDDGTVWLNMGDSYVSTAGSLRTIDAGGKDYEALNKEGAAGRRLNSERQRFGKAERGLLKPKDLCGMPWRLAFALQVDGWWLRQDIIWHKPSPMPESVTDRCTKAHEYLFMLTKAARYYYDGDAIRQKYAQTSIDRSDGSAVTTSNPDRLVRFTRNITNMGANKRSVWTVATAPFKEAHFATFPPKLIEPCILAGTGNEGCCPGCGAPWQRIMDEATGGAIGQSWHDHTHDDERGNSKTVSSKGYQPGKTTGWAATCACGIDQKVPCTVLDPFSGAGTTAMVAAENGRHAIGIELNQEYCDIAVKRMPEPMLF